MGIDEDGPASGEGEAEGGGIGEDFREIRHLRSGGGGGCGGDGGWGGDFGDGRFFFRGSGEGKGGKEEGKKEGEEREAVETKSGFGH